jgi:hypothetical protein
MFFGCHNIHHAEIEKPLPVSRKGLSQLRPNQQSSLIPCPKAPVVLPGKEEYTADIDHEERVRCAQRH